MLAPMIISRRMQMLQDINNDAAPKKRDAARAEWAEAVREKTVLVGMMANPLLWNPWGLAMVGGYAAGKMMTNYARLSRYRG